MRRAGNSTVAGKKPPNKKMNLLESCWREPVISIPVGPVNHVCFVLNSARDSSRTPETEQTQPRQTSSSLCIVSSLEFLGVSCYGQRRAWTQESLAVARLCAFAFPENFTCTHVLTLRGICSFLLRCQWMRPPKPLPWSKCMLRMWSQLRKWLSQLPHQQRPSSTLRSVQLVVSFQSGTM